MIKAERKTRGSQQEQQSTFLDQIQGVKKQNKLRLNVFDPLKAQDVQQQFSILGTVSCSLQPITCFQLTSCSLLFSHQLNFTTFFQDIHEPLSVLLLQTSCLPSSNLSVLPLRYSSLNHLSLASLGFISATANTVCPSDI